MSTPAPLTTLSCDEVEPLLPLVADGQLDETGDPALFAHLADCQHCADSLAAHDLITLTLERRPAAAPSPTLRFPAWQRWLPLAAAAILVVGVGLTLGSGMQTIAPVAPSVAKKPAAAHPTAPVVAVTAIPAPVVPIAPAAPIQIEMEVVAVPGSTPGHPRYLVRRGEQVLLVDPNAAPADAVPATYTTNPAREQVRRY